jgi:hypothetical protein
VRIQEYGVSLHYERVDLSTFLKPAYPKTAAALAGVNLSSLQMPCFAAMLAQCS